MSVSISQEVIDQVASTDGELQNSWVHINTKNTYFEGGLIEYDKDLPNLQLNLLSFQFYCLNFEVDTWKLKITDKFWDRPKIETDQKV